MKISVMQLLILVLLSILLFSDTKKIINLMKKKYNEIRKRGS